MSAPTMPRVQRFTASRDQTCGSPWTCGGVKAGERCGYVGGIPGAGPRPFCGPCCDRVDAGELLVDEPAEQPAPAGDEPPPAAEPEPPAAGEHPTGDTCDCSDVPADVDVCDCASMQNAGFTLAGGLWVHAACGRPTAQYLAARHARGEVDPAGAWGERSAAASQQTPRRLRPVPPAEPETPVSSDPESSGDAEQPARTFRVLVTGSRDWTDRAAIEAAIAGIVDAERELSPTDLDVVVVHGDARGADRLAAEIARERGWRVEPHPADWEGAGKGAGPARNARMVAAGADVCVAFPLGESRGTRDCIARALAADIPIYKYEGPAPEQPAAPRAPRYVDDEVEQWVAGTLDQPTEQQQIEQAVADATSAPETPAEPAPAPETPAAVDEPADDATSCSCGHRERAGTHYDGRPCSLDSAVDEPMPLPDLTQYMREDARNWGADPETTAAEVVDAIRRGILAGDLRSRQVELGPSEVGHECARWLAYRLAGVPHTGSEPTPWRQWVGTLVHDGVDGHLHLDNAEQQTRWLTGIRVNVGELYPGRAITGTLDVFDVATGTVVDLKVPGSTAMRNYGPGKPEREQYRRQVQLYGRGVMRAGYLPAWVAVLRLSPARELSEYVFKHERFDAAIAEQALARAGGIARMVDQLGPRAAALVPPTEATCHRCPWFRPNSPDLTTGCPGAPGADLGRTRRASVDDLVA